MLIISSIQPLSTHKRLFLLRMLFRKISSAAPCTAHSSYSKGITSSLCEQVTFRLQRLVLRLICSGSGCLCHKDCRMPQQRLNCFVTQLFRPYEQTYFDDIFVHNCAQHGRLDIDNHIVNLREILEWMRTNKLYANASTCILW